MRAAKTDANQSDLVRFLRQLGASVAITSTAGDGFPDLVIGFRGRNHLAEVKDPDKSPSKRRLTPDQQRFHSDWRGQIAVIETETDCLHLLGLAADLFGARAKERPAPDGRPKTETIKR